MYSEPSQPKPYVKNTKAETETTKDDFVKMYYISAGQTSLLQVQWDFYIGTCLYVAYFCKTGNS